MWALLITCLAVGFSARADESVVETPLGPVKGLVSASARIFLGLRYANAARWQAPTPVTTRWNSTYDATNDPPGCMQLCDEPPFICPANLVEDCLFLNVWTPRAQSAADGSTPTALPVLVFIHGGRFADGFAGGVSTGLLYEGTNLANGSSYGSPSGLIVVSMNYRLGVLGWLRGPDGEGAEQGAVVGNYGLMDQELALQWVQANIASFGGDPTRVTLMGQSAGAMSVASHMTRPGGGAHTLYHRAILLSEPFSLPFRDTDAALDLYHAFAGYANCSEDVRWGPWRGAHHDGTQVPPQEEGKGEDPVDCLRALPVEAVMAAQKKVETDIRADIKHPMQLFTPYTPTIGTEYMPVHPLHAFTTGQAADVPAILTFTRNESVLFVYAVFNEPVGSTLWYVAVGLLYGVWAVDPLAQQYLPSHLHAGGQGEGYRVYQQILAREGEAGMSKYRSVESFNRLRLELQGYSQSPWPPVLRLAMTHGHEQVYARAIRGQATVYGQSQLNRREADTRQSLSRLGSDSLFICPIRNATLGALLPQPKPAGSSGGARTQPLWLARYDHVMSFSSTAWGPHFQQCADQACHGADLVPVWHPNQAAKGTTYTPQENGLSSIMQGYWATFVATGDPCGLDGAACSARHPAQAIPSRPPWPPFTAHDQGTMVFDTPEQGGTRVLYNVSRADCRIWDTLIGYNY